jgi:hypothetical protein
MSPAFDHTDAAASPFSEWGRREEAPPGCGCQYAAEGAHLFTCPRSLSFHFVPRYCPIEGK